MGLHEIQQKIEAHFPTQYGNSIGKSASFAPGMKFFDLGFSLANCKLLMEPKFGSVLAEPKNNDGGGGKNTNNKNNNNNGN